VDRPRRAHGRGLTEPARPTHPLVGALLARTTFPAAGTPVTCAVSGGADSLALLVLAVAAGCEVTAVHVDHGLRPGSDAEGSVVAADARKGRNPLDDGGVMAILASPDQRLVLDQVAGLMSLLEGHGDVTMDRAGADQIPSAERFGAVLRQRRAQANPFAKFLQKFIGLEAKMKQYEQGERFIEAVELEGGTELLDAAWVDPANLPTIAEIRDPAAWIARVVPTVAA